MSSGTSATEQCSVAYNWIEAIRRKTVKNMTHVEYVHKYSRVRHTIDQLVLILTGLRFRCKEYFVIRIHGALYEPFVGPHYVQIGDEPAFWVHSLTAFRREFFGLTDKLSFERSVFVGLSNGEVVRLKIARPYLFMPHNVALASGSRLRIMKTPTDSFIVKEKDIIKHKDELCDKKRVAEETNQAVRTRVRHHLVGSVQLLFCSYMRDTNIRPEQANQWFHTDIQHALAQCDTIYSSLTRVRPDVDVYDHMHEEAALAHAPKPVLMTSTADLSSVLMGMASRVDHGVADLMRDVRTRERSSPGSTGIGSVAGGAMLLETSPSAVAEYLAGRDQVQGSESLL
jgi:hypothetical protein